MTDSDSKLLFKASKQMGENYLVDFIITTCLYMIILWTNQCAGGKYKFANVSFLDNSYLKHCTN